jgi:hypothetical protein
LSRGTECKSTKGIARGTKPVETRVPLEVQEANSTKTSSQSTSIQGVTVQKT